MAHGDEHHPPGPAALLAHLEDLGVLADLLADPQGLQEFQPTPRPHASVQFDWRQEAAAPGMPVRPDLGHGTVGRK